MSQRSEKYTTELLLLFVGLLLMFLSGCVTSGAANRRLVAGYWLGYSEGVKDGSVEMLKKLFPDLEPPSAEKEGN